ncbi:hypothetical protein B566_EDAN006116 [Ephemera danica]|nr:hypothetical protein B566_EDAN006116 [Ephemera danica]
MVMYISDIRSGSDTADTTTTTHQNFYKRNMNPLSTVEKIQELYDELSAQEEENEKYLETILSRQCHLEAKLKHMVKAVPTLQQLHSDAVQLADRIAHTSELAENVSAKVRQLDLARSRVSECQQRVHDLQDLKLCRDGVQTAMAAGDFEKAAAHVHRFLTMDQVALRRTAAHVSQGRSVDDCFTQLEAAAKELRQMVAKNFDKAAQSDNVDEIDRFFKIFPLLGASEEGLKRFSSHLATKLAATAQQNLRIALETSPTDKRAPVLYADALTLLFEGVARVVEVHQPLLETFYGPGHLLDVMERLQVDCDKESRRILAEMSQRRNLEHIVRQQVSQQGEEAANPIDALDQLALLQLRTITEFQTLEILTLYLADIEVGCEDTRTEALARLERVLHKSELCRSMQDVLGHYLLLERFYMRDSIRKAMQMDAVDTEGGHTSSVLDDAFFIIRKCIRRASSSGSLDGTCAVINDACTLLEIDFGSFLQRQLRQGYSSGYLDLTAQAYNMWQSSIQQGRIGPSSASDSDTARSTFLAHLNNADASIEYISTLRRGLEEEIVSALGAGPSLPTNEHAKLVTCLSGLSTAAAALKHVADYGMQQLRASAVKPRTGPWVDAFLQANHQLTEEDFASYEADEPFVQNLIHNLDGLLSSFKPKLTPSNYDALVGVVTSEVTTQMEKVIMKSSFNRLGGLALDKEVRALAGYLTSATAVSIRDKVARLTQIATVLNLERPAEMADYWGSSAGQLAWRLTASEIRVIMALRVDFKTEDIKKLKL